MDPPLASIATPVIFAAFVDARNVTTCAISFASTIRRIAFEAARRSVPHQSSPCE